MGSLVKIFVVHIFDLQMDHSATHWTSRNKLESTHSQPPPILFSVQNLNLKKCFLQRSYKLCQEIQFRADAWRENQKKKKVLAAELRHQAELGETNLTINHRKIAPKNSVCPGGGYSHQAMEC